MDQVIRIVYDGVITRRMGSRTLEVLGIESYITYPTPGQVAVVLGLST